MNFQEIFTFANVSWPEIGGATIDTFIMLGISLVFTILLGLPLGIALYLTAPGGIYAKPKLYAFLSFIVNVLRSLPFIILLILLIPVTLLITGTSIGVTGAIPPLVFGAAPFFGRLVENVLKEVDKGVIEASQAMGASTKQIIFKVLLPEALPGLISAATVTTVALVSYTAMSGVIGGGGLGDLAVRYGYQRFQTDVMIVTVVLLLILVQVLQTIGDRVSTRLRRK
ncbi:ABC transporter permease [Leeia sp. TBRC 13508]|uniref:ABC transporter permease n=1 Tax=Leeia speluncae TaxID=2884804 RepID=A0ABS8DA02_9NEIS|nr:methionine ABC transporter permease [Leeia speluncae]MCB6185032.1 ABC transporter permease [Leeia speluncae]